MAETLSKQRAPPKAARQSQPAKPAPGGASAWRAELQAAGVGLQAQGASALARAWLAAHTPHLLSVLGTQQIAELNQVLVARQQPQRAGLQATRSDAGEAGEAFYSERVDERLRREQRTKAAPVSSVVWVETADLLAEDTEPSSPTTDPAQARENDFRSRLRQRLVAEPSLLVFDSDAGSPLTLRIKWGRDHLELDHEGGCIHWWHLLKKTEWSQEHPRPPQDDGRRDADRQQRVEELEAVMRLDGSMVELRGQPVGRIHHAFMPDKVLRIGPELGRAKGHVDDTAGRAELNQAMPPAHTATAVVKAADGWLHLFALDPAVRRADLGGSADASGRVLITTRPGDVQGVQQIRLADGTDMQRHGQHWSAAEDTDRLSTLGSVAYGGLIGDFWEDPDATGTVTQILVGCIPIVGQIADARDVAAGIVKLWTSGGHEGKVQTALALAGVLPLGDMVKAAKRYRSKKAVAKVLRDTAAETQQRLAQALLQDASGTARRFQVALPAGRAATQELSAGLRAFEAAGAAAAGAVNPKAAEQAAAAYVKTVKRWLDESGDNAMAVVVLSGDAVVKRGEKLVGWKRVAAALDAAGPEGRALGERMERWRAQQLESVIHDAKKLGQARGAGEVVIKRTGTARFSSDMDVNFLGPDAAMLRNTAQELMQKRFGQQWGNMFDGTFLLDPRRLHLFDQLPSAQRAPIEAVMVKESQLNALARMRNDIYKASGSKDAAVQATVRRDADRLNFRIEELATQWRVSMAEVDKRATDARKLMRDPGLVHKLELELDVLHGRFNAATKPGERAALAEHIAVRQSRVNTANPEAYLTPGGVDLFVTGRDDLAGLGQLRNPTAREIVKAMRGIGPLSASMKHMAAIDNLAMLHHTELAGSLHEQLKGMAKYTERLLLSTDHVAKQPALPGADPAAEALQARIVERLTPLIDANDLFNRLADGMASTKKGAAKLMKQASLTHDVEQAFKLLQQHLDELIATSRSGALADTQRLATLDGQKAIVLRLALRIVRADYVFMDEPA